MCGRISLLLLALTWVANAAVTYDPEEFGWASQVTNENGTSILPEDDPHRPIQTIDTASIIDVDFYLYTQKTKDSPILTKLDDVRLFGGKLDTTKPLKILTHGYFSGRDKFFGKTIRGAYLRSYDYNIINVDWSKRAHSMYNTARRDVPNVGYTLALFIDKLAHQTGIKLEELHLIGHSLGAHISGVAGQKVRNGRIMRITGLDPAGPMFSYHDTDRIRPEAADFVDIIHTCGHGLGFFKPLGHVDFYPNHGTAGQPGCSISFGKCSHARAIEYFAESLTTPEGFVARKCDEWKTFLSGSCDINALAFMGEYVTWNARGQYWLKTHKTAPYSMGPDAAYGKSGNDGNGITPSYSTILLSVILALKLRLKRFIQDCLSIK